MASPKVSQVIQHLAAHEWCGHGSPYGSNLFLPCHGIQEKMHNVFYRCNWRLGDPDARFWWALLTMAVSQKTWCGQEPCLCISVASLKCLHSYLVPSNLPVFALFLFPLKFNIHFYPAPAQEGENGRWRNFFCLAPAPKFPSRQWIPTMSQA